jgi:protein pelota
VVVIASPGFTKDSVYDYIFQEATRTSNKTILQARHKFVRIHVNSPHVHSLVDVLKSPEVSTVLVTFGQLESGPILMSLFSRAQINVQLKETKFAREGIMLDKLSERVIECSKATAY